MIQSVTRRKWMKLFRDEQLPGLFENASKLPQSDQAIPQVHLMVDEQSWLISEYDLNNNQAFGLFINENENPELGFISLALFEEFSQNGKSVLNDYRFYTAYPLATFKNVAVEVGRIITNETLFQNVFKKYHR